MDLNVTDNIISSIEKMGKKVNVLSEPKQVKSEIFNTQDYKYIAEYIVRRYKDVYIYSAYTVLCECGNGTVVRIVDTKG